MSTPSSTCSSSSSSGIQSLPGELVESISCYMEPYDILRLASTSKFWREVITPSFPVFVSCSDASFDAYRRNRDEKILTKDTDMAVPDDDEEEEDESNLDDELWEKEKENHFTMDNVFAAKLHFQNNNNNNNNNEVHGLDDDIIMPSASQESNPSTSTSTSTSTSMSVRRPLQDDDLSPTGVLPPQYLSTRPISHFHALMAARYSSREVMTQAECKSNNEHHLQDNLQTPAMPSAQHASFLGGDAIPIYPFQGFSSSLDAQQLIRYRFARLFAASELVKKRLSHVISLFPQLIPQPANYDTFFKPTRAIIDHPDIAFTSSTVLALCALEEACRVLCEEYASLPESSLTAAWADKLKSSIPDLSIGSVHALLDIAYQQAAIYQKWIKRVKPNGQEELIPTDQTTLTPEEAKATSDLYFSILCIYIKSLGVLALNETNRLNMMSEGIMRRVVHVVRDCIGQELLVRNGCWTLVIFSRPLGASEGTAFLASHVHPPSHLMHLIDPAIDVIEVIRKVIHYYPSTPSTLAKAFWAIVNLSIYAPHKEQVLSHDLDILHRILESVRAWPKHKQLQHRGFFALINLNNHAGGFKRQGEIQTIMGKRRNLLLLLKAMYKFERDEKILRSLLALLRTIAFDNPKNIHSIREMGFVLFILRVIRRHWQPNTNKQRRPGLVQQPNQQTGPHVNVEVIDLAFLSLHILESGYPAEMQLMKDKYKLHLLEAPKLKWLLSKEEEEALMQSDVETKTQSSTPTSTTNTSSTSSTSSSSSSSSSSSTPYQLNRFPFESAVPAEISSRLSKESWADWVRTEEAAMREHTRSFAPYRTQLLLHAHRSGLLGNLTEERVRLLAEQLEIAHRAELEREEREEQQRRQNDPNISDDDEEVD